jgi:uncharacterized protein YbjT (DUF2867 family)
MPGAATAAITGATGFVGRHLWPALAAARVPVRGVTRDRAAAARRWPALAWAEADLADGAAVAEALAGCGVAYYLVHSIGEGGDYRRREVAAARAFAEAAGRAGVDRIVYLGGVAPRGRASEHLASRLEVGAALRAGPVPAVELRAGMVVGDGSLSWRIVRDLAARLPVMLVPRWMLSRMEPVAIDDVVAALVGARTVGLAAGAVYDLPGPERLSGRQIVERTADALGLARPLIAPVPVLSPGLSAHWLRLVSGVDYAAARELVLGFTGDLLAEDDGYWRLIGHDARLPFAAAARRALGAEALARRPLTWRVAAEHAIRPLRSQRPRLRSHTGLDATRSLTRRPVRGS